MSSRQEEKERRRQERIAAEEADRRAQARGNRMRVVLVGVLAVVIVAGAAFAIASNNDAGGGGGGGGGEQAALPEQREEALIPAARAARCEIARPRAAGANHTSEKVRYQTNPPTSGDHDPVPAQDGQYDAGNPPDIEQSVHALEHGRVNIQYKPGLAENAVAQFRTLYSEEVKGQGGYHTLLFENQSNMKPQIAATAWGRSLTCPQFNDRVFDAIRAFRNESVDKAPEFVP